MCRTIKLCLLLALFPAALSAPIRAENWPGWRGPRGDGTSLEKNVPTRWSASDNVAWKTAVPGKGHASPIVWQDRIFVVTCLEDSHARVLLCFDRASGRQLWQQ